MKAGDYVYTPRFCTVRIQKVYESEASARMDGYTEPTYWEHHQYGILGKSLDLYRMEFAAYRAPTKKRRTKPTMKHPMTESEIHRVATLMLSDLGRPETDTGALEEIKLYLRAADAMYRRGFEDGTRAALDTPH